MQPNRPQSDHDHIEAFRARYEILSIFTDDEIGRLAMSESGTPLKVGEEYVDLEAPDRGVQTVREGQRVLATTVIAHGRVLDSIWTKLSRAIALRG